MKSYTQSKEEIKSDLEALERAKINPSAFRPIYERHFRKILLFVMNRVYDKDMAADITSQVFLKALTKAGSFKDKGLPVSAWLYRIAINECTNFFRKTDRPRYVVIDDLFYNFLKDEIRLEEKSEEVHTEKLLEALKELPVDKMQLIELRFYEGKSFQEIGHILGITENNAKVRTYRILDGLKNKMLNMKWE